MAMAACKECGNQISTSAKACPQCGAAPAKSVSFLTILKWVILTPVIVWIGSCVWIMSGIGGSETQAGAPAKGKAVAAGCSVADFEVTQFNPRVRDNCRASSCAEIVLVGELRNNCKEPMGAQLRITGKDASGKIVEVVNGWPASISNIGAGASFPFDMTGMMSYDPSIKTFEVEIQEVKQWRSR